MPTISRYCCVGMRYSFVICYGVVYESINNLPQNVKSAEEKYHCLRSMVYWSRNYKLVMSGRIMVIPMPFSQPPLQWDFFCLVWTYLKSMVNLLYQKWIKKFSVLYLSKKKIGDHPYFFRTSIDSFISFVGS